MSKPRSIKNLLRLDTGSYSVATTGWPSALQPSQAGSSSLQPQQTCPSVPVASEASCTQHTHDDHEHEGPSVSSKSKVGKKSRHTWVVEAIDEHGATKKINVKLKDVFSLPTGQHVIVRFNKHGVSIEVASGLLAGVCGRLATNSLHFPVSFEKWSLMPASFLDRVFNGILLPRFAFNVDQEVANRDIDQKISKMWGEYRLNLWDELDDRVRG